jgi:hypothetical protein
MKKERLGSEECSEVISNFFAIKSHVTPLRTGITSFNASNPQNPTKDHEKTKFVGLCYEP